MIYQLRSELQREAVARGLAGLNLRLARAFKSSGDELGLRLSAYDFSENWQLWLDGGYRLNAGRERWKSSLELSLLLIFGQGFDAGIQVLGALLYDPAPWLGFLFQAGASGAVGSSLVGNVLLSVGLQLRF